jgi:c-di-GMP-binding flagellar brake protein YcgR
VKIVVRCLRLESRVNHRTCPDDFPTTFEKSMTTQRRYIRISHSSEIWIGQNGFFYRLNGHLETLSAGGAFLKTVAVLPINMDLEMRFRLHDTGEYISCRAIVRNVKSGEGCGVEFQDISAEDRQRIRAYVENQALSEVLRDSFPDHLLFLTCR